jgi:hypothetical protein
MAKDGFDSLKMVKKNEHINLPLLCKPGKPLCDETALADISAYSSTNKVLKTVVNSLAWKELSW